MAQNPDIKLLIGAKGGASPDGTSAVRIRQELQAALGGKNGVKVNVRLASNVANNLRQEIQKALNANGGIEVKLKGQIAGAISNSASAPAKEISDEVVARKIQDGLERTIANRKKEAKRQELAQNKAINKTLEEQWKLQQKNSKAANQAVRITSDFSKYLSTVAPKGLKESEDEISNIYDLLRRGTAVEVEEAKDAIDRLKAHFKDMGYEGGNTFTYLQQKVRSFMTYLASSAFTMLFVTTFRNAKQAVIDLNKALVDLRMVTGGSIAQTEQLIKQYNKMAQKLGVTTTTITEAAVGWQRQGYNLKDTETLIRNSTILAKVGFLDAAEAQQYLTSMMKGYQISVEDSMSIVDKLAAVDTSAAVSAGGLAEAISKTANSARLAGVDLDTLIGYLAAVGEVTQQDMSSLGNAFKTMFARYSNVKLGRLEDDEGESLNDYETVLNSIGIALRNAEGEFRNFGEVWDEVVSKYAGLDNVTQSAIAQALGSTRQREGVLTLLDNIDNAAKYTEVSLNSAGTAMEKFGAYEEGLEAKAAGMKSAFEGMADTIIPDWLIGMFYDAGTGLAHFVSIANGVPARIAAIIAVLYALRTAIEMVKASQLGESMTYAAAPLQSFLGRLKTAPDVWKAWRAGALSGTDALKGFGIAINGSAAAVLGVLAALTLVTAGIVYFATASERAIQNQRKKTEELKEQYSDLISEIKSLEGELTSVGDRIDELQGKGSLSFVEQEELARLEKQNELLTKQIELRKLDAAEKAKETNESIAKEFELEYNTTSPKYQSIKPENQVTRTVYAQGEQEDITTGKAITQLELYDELIERAKELDALRKGMTADEWLASGNQAELDRVNGEIDQMSNGFGTLARKVEDAEGSGAEAFKTYYDLFKLGQDAQNGIFWSTAADAAFNKVWDDSKFKSVRDKLQAFADNGGVTVDVLNGDEFKDFLAALGPNLTDTSDKMDDLASHINSLGVSADDGTPGFDSLKTALAGLSDETTVLRSALEKLGDSEFMDWLQGADGKWENLKSLLDKFPNLRDELEAYEAALTAGEDPQKAFIELHRAMNAALQDFNADKVYEGVNDVVDAFNDYGAGSNQVLQAVQNLDRYIPGLTNQLYSQDSAFSQLHGTTQLTADAFYEYCAAAIEAERTSREINISNLTTDLSDLAAMAMTAGHSMKEAMGLAKDEAYNRSGESFGIDDSMAKLTEWYETSMANLEGARNRWQRSQSSKKSSGSDVYVPDVDPLYQYLQTVEDINDELDGLDVDEKLLDEDDFEGKNKLIEDRIAKLEELKTALHDLNNARDVEIKTAVSKLNGYGNFQAAYDEESGQALINNMDALKGLTGDAAKAAEALISAIESGSKAALSTSKEYMEALVEQNNLLKEQKELREEEAEDQADDALERIKNRITRFQNRQEVFATNIDHQNVMRNLGEEKQAYQDMIDLAVRRGKELRAAGAKDDDPELAKWSQTYFEGIKGMRDANRKMVNEILKPYDEFIFNADTYSWWDNLDDTKADVLSEKLAKIHDMYKTGLIPDAEMYKELVNETAEALYKEQLDAIDQAIEYTEELIKKEHELREEELEEQKSDYKAIVDAKKESLRASKEEADYQKSVAEKVKAISKLQQQINTLSLSDDRRDIAERKKLELELSELQGELSDTQADHSLSAQEDALDKSYDAFEKEKDDEIEVVKAEVDTVGKVYALAIDRINSGWDDLYEDLVAWNKNYADGIKGEDGLEGAWKTAKSAASEYFDVLDARQGLEKKYVSASGGNIAVGDTDVYKDKYGLDWDTHKTVQEKANQMRSNSNAWHAANSAGNTYLAGTYVSKNEELVKEIESLIGKKLYRDGDGVWHINDGQGTQLYKVYHKGGIVGSNEEFAKVEKGELVVPKEHVQPTMKMLEWGNSLASKMRGLFSGGGLVSSSMSDAIKGAPLSPAANAIVNNNAPSLVVNAPVEVKYDGSASPADAKKFGENITAGIVEAFHRKGIGTGAKPLGVTI